MRANIRLPETRLLAACLLFFSLFFIYQSCTKMDAGAVSSKGALTDAEITQKFFNVPADAPAAVKRAAEDMKQRNRENEYAVKFAKQNGYPVWDKAFLPKGHMQAPSNTSFTAGNSAGADTVVIIPIVQQGAAMAAGFISASLTGGVSLGYYRGGDYAAYGFNDVPADSINADKAAIQLMVVSHKVFGYNRFEVRDKRLFHASANYADTARKTTHITINDSTGNGGGSSWYEQCLLMYTTTYTNHCPYGANMCRSGGRPGCDNCVPTCADMTVEVSTQCILYPDGGGPAGSPGEGGGAGTNPPFPCAGSQGRQMPLADPCGTPPAGPPVVPEPEEPPKKMNPCEYMDSLKKSPYFIAMMVTLKDSLNAGHEIGYSYENPLQTTGTINQVYFRGSQQGLAINATLVQKQSGFGHNHNNQDSALNIYSVDDIAKFFEYYSANKMTQPEYFTMPLVTGSSSFVMMIRDTAAFGVFGRKWLYNYDSIKELANYYGNSKYPNIVSEDSSVTANTIHFMQKLKYYANGDPGIKLFLKTGINTYMPVTNYNGTLVQDPCN